MILNSLTFILKVLNGLLPTQLQELLKFVKDLHTYNTRLESNFYVTAVKSYYSQKNILANGLILSNTLPDTVKNSNKCEII